MREHGGQNMKDHLMAGNLEYFMRCVFDTWVENNQK